MRVVIKVGTSLIAPGGQIDANLLRAMVDQFDLSKNEYLIVTSGAIAAGMSGLGLEKRLVALEAGIRLQMWQVFSSCQKPILIAG